eukprot:scaffold40463_cov206-Amphora_coffeaeformis.AAC.1
MTGMTDGNKRNCKGRASKYRTWYKGWRKASAFEEEDCVVVIVSSGERCFGRNANIGYILYTRCLVRHD